MAYFSFQMITNQSISVTAAFIEKDGKILIARRNQDKHLGGFWELPGGKIEDGESPEDCLKRELFEEFAIQVEVLELIGESYYEYPEKLIKLLGYKVKFLSGNFELKDHDQIIWVTLKQIFNYQLAPADIPLIVKYGHKNFN